MRRNFKMKRFYFSVLTALLLLGTIAPHTLRAAPQNVTFNVNSTLDEVDANPGDGKCKSTPSKKCTLRAAVMETNALGGSNTIVLPAGTLFFNLGGVNEDNAATGDLDIKSNLTLVGAGASSTYLNALALDRAFHVINGKTVIKNMTIRNGLALNSGGGIYVNSGASLKFIKSVVKESIANYNGGGIAGYGAITVNRSTVGPLNRDSFGGGGIASSFKLTLVKSIVTQNSTGSSGGIGQGGGGFLHMALPSCAKAPLTTTSANSGAAFMCRAAHWNCSTARWQTTARCKTAVACTTTAQRSCAIRRSQKMMRRLAQPRAAFSTTAAR